MNREKDENNRYDKNGMRKHLYKALQMMNERAIVLPIIANVYIYHHCGRDKFQEVGSIFIDIVNKEYRKSYVIVLPDQKFPLHYHKIKQESYYVLSGELIVEIEGVKHIVPPGGIIDVERGQMHSFTSINGAVFEEISTTYTQNDSFFEEEILNKNPYDERRTVFNQEEWKEIYKLWKE